MNQLPPSPQTTISVRRIGPEAYEDARRLFTEYFDLIGNPAAGVWLAYADGLAAGCVALRPLPAIPEAAECKRLYVASRFRRRGIAEALLAQMERDAAAFGYRAIYLDSKEDLRAALALYERAGYTHCARYNDNPQASVFMSKRLA
jgi:ribosomal protein S18 acetylase RimI-like enzyme